jgi:hypothetical protein
MNYITVYEENAEIASEVLEEGSEVDITDSFKVDILDSEEETLEPVIAPIGSDESERSEEEADPLAAIAESDTECLLLSDDSGISEQLDRMESYLGVAVFAILVFVCVWLLRSWRTWMVKGGRI